MSNRRGPWSPRARALLDAVVTPLLYVILITLRVLPRAFLLGLSARLAALAARLLRVGVARRNLRAVHGASLGSDDERALVARGLEHLLATLVDVVKVLDQGSPAPEAICALEGREHLEAAVAEGRGVVLVSLHTGNWEVGAARIGALGHPFSILYFEQIAPRLDAYLNGLRSRHGVKLHHQRRGLLGAFRDLRHGGILGVMADQDGTRAGIFTRFFGLTVSVPRGIAAFARRTRARVVLTYNLRRDDGSYVQTFEPVEIPPPELEEEPMEAELADRLLARFEQIIRRDPAQWLLAYDRFKLRHESRLEELGILESSRCERQRLEAPAGCADSPLSPAARARD